MQIEFNGQKEEAYSLTIYKTHAKAIASGEKTVEIRSYSAEGKGDKREWPMKDIFAIHFYDRGGRYSLDVLLDYCGLACMCKEDIEMLGEKFGFHDYDNEWQQYAKLPAEERPWFFWFHVCDIVNSKGL